MAGGNTQSDLAEPQGRSTAVSGLRCEACSSACWASQVPISVSISISILMSIYIYIYICTHEYPLFWDKGNCLGNFGGPGSAKELSAPSVVL